MALDLNAFAVFAKVVELGSFTAAGRALHLSKSMVSRQVAALEDTLGVRLLNRTTRRISPTEAGLAFFERARGIVAEAEEAEREALSAQAAVRGRLRVNAPMSFGITELGPVMPELLRRYPELEMELTLDDRRVDLMQEGFDVSLRISALIDSSFIARQLAPVRRIVVGAPAYFEKHGVPRHPHDLAQHACLLYTLLPRPDIFEFKSREGERVQVAVKGRLHCNNADALNGALHAGLGIALSPEFMCWQGLRSGALQAVLLEWESDPLLLHVIYPHNRHLSPKVRAFVDFAVEQFGPGHARWCTAHQPAGGELA